MSDTRLDSIVYPPKIGSKNTEGVMRKVATATTAATHRLFRDVALAITSSTDATPIVLTVAAGHGYVAGDRVKVAGHLTNVAANGKWTVQAVGGTTITLTGSVGSGGGAGSAGTIEYEDPDLVIPKTKCWVAFEALTNDCYIRIGGVATAGTDADNGTLIKAGATPGVSPAHLQKFYLDPTIHTNVDILSTTGAGVLKWWVCSPPGERNRF